MRVLVTGSHGYIGSVMVPMLMEAGHDVTGLDSDLYRKCTYGPVFPDIPLLKKDIRDVENTDLEGFEAVIHLAALSNDPLGDLNPHLTLEINHAATIRLAELAKAAGSTRFIFSSSCSMYGAAGEDILDEHAKFQPVTPYAVSKVFVERDLAKLADTGFSPTYLRNSTVYGVSPRMRFDLVLNNLVAWAYTTGLVMLKSDGTPWRPIVHIEDLSRAFIAVLHAPRSTVHNQAYNIGIQEENYRIRDLAEMVRELVPGSRIEYGENASPDRRSYRVDFRKYTQAFPDSPLSWNARRGISQIFESYRTYGLKQADFEGPRYMRIAHIKELMAEGFLDGNLRWKDHGNVDAGDGT
jgi:nucleoside-diphosphate-sugar epimerase